MNIPDGLQYWTADEIAECLPVGNDTYRRLWQITSEASNTKPLGGDGTGGTVEWPEVRDDCGNQPRAFWAKLTKEEQEDITRAYYEEFPSRSPNQQWKHCMYSCNDAEWVNPTGNPQDAFGRCPHPHHWYGR